MTSWCNKQFSKVSLQRWTEDEQTQEKLPRPYGGCLQVWCRCSEDVPDQLTSCSCWELEIQRRRSSWCGEGCISSLVQCIPISHAKHWTTWTSKFSILCGLSICFFITFTASFLYYCYCLLLIILISKHFFVQFNIFLCEGLASTKV